MATDTLKKPPSDAIKHCVIAVWNAIGPDAEAMVGTRNDEAVECCIDANRPSFFDGDRGTQIEAELRVLYNEHGYPKVLKWLSKHIRLV